jgi:hypothetical protein
MFLCTLVRVNGDNIAATTPGINFPYRGKAASPVSSLTGSVKIGRQPHMMPHGVLQLAFDLFNSSGGLSARFEWLWG